MAEKPEQFVALLKKTSGIEETMDRTADPWDKGFIDIVGGGVETQVIYRPAVGFGFFTEAAFFGQRPDVLIAEPNAAVDYVLNRAEIERVRAS